MSEQFGNQSPGADGAGALRHSGTERIGVLDLWRTVCVWMMLADHLLWDLALLGYVPAELPRHPALRVYAFAGAGGFILLSGLCVRLSRNPFRRGLGLLCAGAGVSVVSALAGYPVRFGILQLLGCCMLLWAGLNRLFSPTMENPRFPLACLLLFAASAWICAQTAVGVTWLYPLGLRGPEFVSADYYPLLPWWFLFLCGTSLGRYLDAPRFAPLLRKRFPPALTFWGRHALAVYLLHQPLLWGLLLLLRRLG